MRGPGDGTTGKSTRLVFMGSDPIAIPAFEYMAAGADKGVRVEALFTQPDRPSGRGKKLKPGSIKRTALSLGIPVFQPERVDMEAESALREIEPDVILVMAYGHLLRKSVLKLPRFGIYNLHGSILPAYRGASPVETALASGEAVTGVTLMKMVRKMDAGPIADTERVQIDRLETGGALREKLAGACIPLLERNLDGLLSGALACRSQNEDGATYTRRLTKGDANLDFREDASVLAHRINAFQPWPGAMVPYEGGPVRIGLADWREEGAAAAPGTIMEPNDEGLPVACGKGTLLCLRLQRPGGRLLPWEEFLRGFRISPGTVLPSCPMEKLVSPTPWGLRKKRNSDS